MTLPRPRPPPPPPHPPDPDVTTSASTMLAKRSMAKVRGFHRQTPLLYILMKTVFSLWGGVLGRGLGSVIFDSYFLTFLFFLLLLLGGSARVRACVRVVCVCVTEGERERESQ